VITHFQKVNKNTYRNKTVRRVTVHDKIISDMWQLNKQQYWQLQKHTH